MGTTRVTLRLPEELLDQAEVVAEVTQQNRTEIVTEALHEYLSDIENDESYSETAVERYLDDEIEFDTLSTIIGHQNANSVRSSKTILDHGDELADRMTSP